MPRITLVAFEERTPGGFIFVAVPTLRGRYIRTNRCVAVVACGHCGATIGEPCKTRDQTTSPDGYHSEAHVARKTEFKRLPRARRQEAGDLLCEGAGAEEG